MQKATLSRVRLALGAVLGCASWSMAVDIVHDTWIDGTRTDPAAPVYSENGVDLDSDGNLESAWYLGGSGTLDAVGPGGPLRGTGFGTSSASWTTYFAPEASPITLSSIGDVMKVTWVFTPTNVNTTNTSQGFRIALVDSPAASRIVADATPGNATYTGYGIFANMGQTLGHSNSFQLVERSAPGTASALLSATGSWTGLGNGATNGAPGYANNTEYTFEMTLTRGAGGVLDIVASMSGGNLNTSGLAQVVFTDTTPNGGSFSFDTFQVRPSSAALTADTFDTRRFRVEYIPIPEPAALGALALAGALGLRRKR
ncbi:MAG: PEP-CTERM sorting domain-containing protein [Phycisphaerae bacterium]|nr:PEP-CTERM sorting domain-containing protein [Phycisphaerae bacterium]MDW8262238.1 PEP-CTERM sorting domain-containing protein [Phycisphaerales bacterium]